MGIKKEVWKIAKMNGLAMQKWMLKLKVRFFRNSRKTKR
jgi:hypothetical protein